MANKTIYIKDEALWERAKALAGKDGLSALIGRALADFLEQKDAESHGLSPQSIDIVDSYGGESETIRFWGKRLGDRLFGRGPDSPNGTAEVFQTKSGKLVLVLRDAVSFEAFEYRTFETPEELARDSQFAQIPPEARSDFEQSIAEAIGHKWATWID